MGPSQTNTEDTRLFKQKEQCQASFYSADLELFMLGAISTGIVVSICAAIIENPSFKVDQYRRGVTDKITPHLTRSDRISIKPSRL